MIDNKKTRVCLSGVSGFIGSHILSHILKNTDWEVIGIASWTHKGTPERIVDDKYYQEHKNRVKIITHDLIAPLTERTLSEIGQVDYIINVASDSHVDRSITHPVELVKNNTSLVLHMLEAARVLKPKKFLQFSTDEVYGAAPEGVDHKEWSAILPSNPYSASKAAQEAIAISYWRTYGVPLIITNLMNVFGERQDSEKYLAKCISYIQQGKTLTIHGNEKYIGSRFYIHARNVADAILYIVNKVDVEMYTDGGKVDRPARFNIVGDKEMNNLDVAKLIAGFLGKELKYELVDFHNGRPGHDRRYALDGTKLKEHGWTSPINFEDSLRKYVEWSVRPENAKWL